MEELTRKGGNAQLPEELVKPQAGSADFQAHHIWEPDFRVLREVAETLRDCGLCVLTLSPPSFPPHLARGQVQVAKLDP